MGLATSNRKIIWIGACLIVTLTLGALWRQNFEKENRVNDFIQAEAIIIQVFPASISRFGIKPARYGLKFKALDGNTYFQYNVILGNKHEINDRIFIFYDPQNPDEPIVDKIE